ncbi:ribosomal-processing cysteine protease Prp [Soehngenia saccharolytica]|nr:ribosomal-processing cysteine protease Prp [Soehngenia saccharolytica]
MIIVKLFRKNSIICGYEVKGHAEYKPYGQDIVCAGVSTLSYTALNSLIEVINIDISSIYYNIEDEEGYMYVMLKDNIDSLHLQDAQIIFKTFLTGIRLLNEEYDEYISIEFEEVD